MPHRKAKDLMVPMVDFLTPDIRLTDAVKMMRATKRSDEKYGVKGLPVVNENGHLAGMLSLQEIKKAIFPFYMSMMELGDVTFDGMFELMSKKLRDKTVGEVMSTDIKPVPEGAPVMECMDHMMKHNMTRVPVVDEFGRVVGIVYELDLFYIVVDILLAKEDEIKGAGN
jgi:CBS domain-containing protein